MRIYESLLVLGIALLVVSFVPVSYVYTSTENIAPESYAVYRVATIENVHLKLEVIHGHPVSLYILDSTDTLLVAQEGSIENTSPLFEFEGVLSINETIALPAADIYFFLVTWTGEEADMPYYRIEVSGLVPHIRTFVASLLCVLSGLCWYGTKRFRIDERFRVR
jgi:hypothetical protein